MEKQSVALNRFIDRAETLLPSFEGMPLKIMKTVIQELTLHHDAPMSDPQSPFSKYETIVDVGVHAMSLFQNDPNTADALYSFFHSQGLHRPSMETLFEYFWDFGEELV